MQGTIVSLAPKTIKDHLMFAKNKGLKFPRLVLQGYKFTLAPDTGRNAGAVYIKAAKSGEYLGKLVGTVIHPMPIVDMRTMIELVTIKDDPIAAATVHGQQTGTCCCCGRELTAAESIGKMVGPICAEKYGF